MESFLQKTPTQQKAYAMAFVLTMKQVLAQDSTTQPEKKGQFQELLDQIVVSVQQPSADHLNIYIGLVLAMAFLGYFLYTAFGADKPKLYKEQLHLSDLVDTTQESVNKDSAFHKKLDQEGPYAREPSGILTKDSLLKLRRAISEKAYMDFKDRREELMNERVSLMKQNKQQEYMQAVGRSINEYREQVQKVTQSAINFLDITEEDYVNSFKSVAQQPEHAKLVEQIEMEVREKYEPQQPLNKPAAEYKKIYCEKLQMEAQAEIQIQQQSVAAKNPMQAQQIAITLKTQVLDRIYAQHGIKAVDLQRAVNHFNLDKDPDVESIKKANSQIKTNMMERQQQVMAEMNKELGSVFDEEFKQRYEAVVKDHPKGQVSPNGFIVYEDFVKIQQLINDFLNEATQKQMTQHKAVRRSYLKSQQEQKYQECIGKFMATQKQMHQILTQIFVKVSGVDLNVFNNSGQFYGKQEKFRQAVNEYAMKLAIAHEDKTGKVLEAEKCTKAVNRIEEAKIHSIDQIQKLVQAQRVPEHAAPIILEVDKCRTLDKLFFDEQIENEDIGRTVRELKLQETPEFKEMIKKCQEKFAAAQATWGPR